MVGWSLKGAWLVWLLSLLQLPARAVSWQVSSKGSGSQTTGATLGSLQKAIHLASAGDTIYVHKGVYKEGLIQVDKPLVLIGIGRPTLDGEGKGQILSIKADAVTVKGFRLIRSGVSSLEDIAGIKVYSRKEVRIMDNILEGTFFGIFLEKSEHCVIMGNQISGLGKTDQQSGNGIHCWGSDQVMILNNHISGHRDGIYFEFVTRSLIRGNSSSGNSRYGLHFMFSNEDVYINNVFKNNNAGVSVMFSKGVTMLKNHFEDNWGDGCYGIFLKELTDSRIFANRIVKNTTGISVEGSNRILIKNNVFEANGWALKIDASCLSDTVSHNNFMGNSFDIATTGTAVENLFTHNYWDKYEGYDRNKDRIGDIAYHPVSMFSMIVAQNPTTMILFRSVMANLFDKMEKLLPGITPVQLVDPFPFMQPINL